MTQRVVSTVGLWTFVILSLCFFKGQAGVWLIAILAACTQYELYGLFRRMGMRPFRRTGILAGTVIVLSTYYLPGWEMTTNYQGLELLALVILLLSVAMIGLEPAARKIENLAATLFGLFYVPFLLQFYVLILQLTGYETEGLFLAIWLVVTAKFTDVGGLLIGTKLGKNKLAPSISPGKTWEGVTGGVLVSMLAGSLLLLAFGEFFPKEFTFWRAIFMAVPVAVLSIVSDLLESLIKRQAGVKDSGRMIPGIGGAFDLMDSLILCGPAGYLIFKYIVL